MTRVLVRSLLALVVLAAATAIGWRVLAPAEQLEPAATPYPMAVVRMPGVTGRTNVAPLIVEDRIRVYAAKNLVRADAPVDAKGVYTPYWSYRRWPEQLSGVVASGPTVITRWSDGRLVALDGHTGKIAWRADGPAAPPYAGHRTGAATVWNPPGLRLAAGIVVVAAADELAGYDVRTGARRWRAETPTGCTDGFTTVGGQYVCPTGTYDTASGRLTAPWPDAPVTPLGCAVARSLCAGVRNAAGRGWLTTGPTPVREPGLDPAGSTVAILSLIHI